MNSKVNRHTSIKLRSNLNRDRRIKSTRYGYEQIIGKDYAITNQISTGRNTRATRIPTYETPEIFPVMQSGVGDTGEA